MPAPTGHRAGVALVTVVLLTLALFVLGHGMLTLSLGELAASRAAVRHLEARGAGESAVNVAFARAAPPWLDSLAIGAERSLDGLLFGRAEGAATLRRLGPETWWVEGLGRMGVAESAAARLAWALDPVTRVTSLAGAVGMPPGAPLVLAGTLDVGTPTAVEPPLTDADCAPWLLALEAHYATDPLSVVASLPDADTLPALGLLDFAALLAGVDMVLSSSGTPTPAEWLGACDTTEPWNWGDPDRPWRPCGGFFALRGAGGSVEVAGGAGQGVLVVDGDLTLRGDTRFYGLVLASGALRLEDDALLAGMTLVGDGVYVGAGARVSASACWAVRALAAQRGTLGRLRVVPGVGNVGPL